MKQVLQFVGASVLPPATSGLGPSYGRLPSFGRAGAINLACSSQPIHLFDLDRVRPLAAAVGTAANVTLGRRFVSTTCRGGECCGHG